MESQSGVLSDHQAKKQCVAGGIALADEHPSSPGPLGRIIRFAKESSSWVTRIFAALLVVYLSAKAGFSYVDHPTSWDELADRVFIYAGFMILLIGSIIREASRIRKERYVNTLEKLQAIGSQIKDLNTYLGRQSERGDAVDTASLKTISITSLQRVLDDFSDIFSMVTGTICRTTIKLIFVERDTIYVYTLTRDSQSAAVNARYDKERYDKRQDKLEENDDFSAIWDQRIEYFIENNLPARRDYHNTSFLVYGARPTGTSIITRWFASVGWNLPYRSAMVFPIRQLGPTTGGEDEAGCIGFVTVDSAFRRVFKPRFDGPLGATVANALFHPVSVYTKLIAEAERRG